MHPIPENDRFCYEDQHLGRHKSMSQWQRLGIAIFIDAASCLLKDPESREYLKAKQWIANKNYGFEYWACVVGADPDILRETLIKGLFDPKKLREKGGPRKYFRRIQSRAGEN